MLSKYVIAQQLLFEFSFKLYASLRFLDFEHFVASEAAIFDVKHCFCIMRTGQGLYYHVLNSASIFFLAPLSHSWF